MGCYNDSVLFVHIPKTGGTAIKTHLWEHAPAMRGQRPGSDPREAARRPDEVNPFPIGHIRLRDALRLSGKKAEDFQHIVAVVRNPYVQQVSQWLFWKARWEQGGRHPHDITAGRYTTIHPWLEDANCDFHRWYLARVMQQPADMAGPWNGYKDFPGYYVWWLMDDTGRVPPNIYLLRQEHLADDYAALWAKLEYPEAPPLPVVNRGAWSEDKTMKYYLHDDRRPASLRALDLVEAKFRFAFQNWYPKLDRSQLAAAGWEVA